LKIVYSKKRIERVCTNASIEIKEYGKEMSYKIHQRIDEIHAADTVEEMIQFRVGRCHPLQGDKKNQYAVDLVHPFRLIFEKVEREIRVVNIIEIVDYHK
jgi:proteic killer suppression protein